MTFTTSAQSRNRNDRDEAYRIVRRFSQHINDEYPQNNLAQALAVREEYEETCEESREERRRSEALLTAAGFEQADSA